MARLDEINALAERSPGFVWRYISDSRDSAHRQFEDARVLFNMSVWESVEALHAFTYRSLHAGVFAARKKWFDEWKSRVGSLKELGERTPSTVLWWVPVGHRPEPAEGLQKLQLLGVKGPHAQAFTFKCLFDPKGVALDRR